MTWRTRTLPFASIAVIFISFAVVPVRAGDRSFSSVVNHIKGTYRAKQQGFFGGMMLARFAVKVVRPAGVKNFKLVMLKNLDFSDGPGRSEFHAAARRLISNEWEPLVQYNSRKNNQYTHVYVQQEKEDVKLLVVTLQKSDAFIVQTKFSPEKLSKFIDDPKIMGISLKDTDDEKPNGVVTVDSDEANKGEKKPVTNETDAKLD